MKTKRKKGKLNLSGKKRGHNSEKIGDKRYGSQKKPVKSRIHEEEPIGEPI